MAITNVKNPGRMNVKMARIASTGNLAALVLAGVFYLLGMKIPGIVMLCLAMLAFCVLIGTGVHRIAGGQPLDDVERDLMQKGYYWSYWIVGTLLILGILALQLFDRVSILMQSEKVHAFLFWAVMSMVIVIPAAVLAWQMPTEEIEED